MRLAATFLVVSDIISLIRKCIINTNNKSKTSECDILKIEISDHARDKLSILRSRGIKLSEEQLEDVVLHPQKILNAWEGRLIAEKNLDESHVLRVVYVK